MSNDHDDLPFGLYERLVTAGLKSRLLRFDSATTRIVTEELDATEAHATLARHLANLVAGVLRALPQEDRGTAQRELTNQIIRLLAANPMEASRNDDLVENSPEQLLAIQPIGTLPQRLKVFNVHISLGVMTHGYNPFSAGSTATPRSNSRRWPSARVAPNRFSRLKPLLPTSKRRNGNWMKSTRDSRTSIRGTRWLTGMGRSGFEPGARSERERHLARDHRLVAEGDRPSRRPTRLHCPRAFRTRQPGRPQ